MISSNFEARSSLMNLNLLPIVLVSTQKRLI